MRVPEKEEKVFLGGRKTPYRIVGFGHLHGEKAVALIRNSEISDYRRWRKLQSMGAKDVGDASDYFEIARRVPVADLVWDIKKRGWRERWQQVEMDLPEKKEVAGGETH